MGEEKAYIVRSMKAKCDCGTMENYLNVVHGHGVYYKGEPLLNANDHYKDENLSHFGDCNSKKVYEDAKKQADEKYKAEEGDGFFESVGKGIGSFFTKAAITLKSLMFNKCDLQTPTPWIFTNEEHVIDGAPALTIESKCACLYGGVITIVMEVEEVPAEEAAAEEETALKTIGTLAAGMAAAVQEEMGVIIKGDGLQSASVSPNSIPTVGMSVETAGNIQDSEPVRAKEVREETERTTEEIMSKNSIDFIVEITKKAAEQTLNSINKTVNAISENCKTLLKSYETGKDGDEYLEEGKPALSPYTQEGEEPGTKTIGWGHMMTGTEMYTRIDGVTVDLYQDDTRITEEDAEIILKGDIEKREKILNTQMKNNNVSLSQQQYDAIFLLLYQIGEDIFIHQDFGSYFKKGDFSDEEELKYQFGEYTDEGVLGTMLRRLDELDIIIKNDYTREGNRNDGKEKVLRYGDIFVKYTEERNGERAAWKEKEEYSELK